MQTWALVLIVSASIPGGGFAPTAMTSIPGYYSAEACKLAGQMMVMADAQERLQHGKSATIIKIEPRCVPGADAR